MCGGVICSVRVEITLRLWMQWELFLDVVVACRLSVCPSSRNHTRGNPPKEMSGYVSVNQQNYLGLVMDRTYSGGRGSGSDEKYESSIASVADGRAWRSMRSNFSTSVTTSRGKSLEISALSGLACSKEHGDSLRPFQRKDIIVLLHWRHQTVPWCSEQLWTIIRLRAPQRGIDPMKLANLVFSTERGFLEEHFHKYATVTVLEQMVQLQRGGLPCTPDVDLGTVHREPQHEFWWSIPYRAYPVCIVPLRISFIVESRQSEVC